MRLNRRTVVILAIVLTIWGTWLWTGGAEAATHPSYPRHGQSCRAGYRSVTARHVVKGKSIRYVLCAWIVAPAPVTSTTLPVTTTPQPGTTTTTTTTTTTVSPAIVPSYSGGGAGGYSPPPTTAATTTTTIPPPTTPITLPTIPVQITATLVVCHNSAQEYPNECEYTVTGTPIANGVPVPFSSYYFTVSTGVLQIGTGTITGDSVTAQFWTAGGSVSVTFGFPNGSHLGSTTLPLAGP